MSHPNVPQADRDQLADLGLLDLDDRAGTGQDADHDDELVAT